MILLEHPWRPVPHQLDVNKKDQTRVIDTLTQEDFHGAFQKLLGRYIKNIVTGVDYFEGD